MNLNIKWTPAPSGSQSIISRKMSVNVAESGLVKPGNYAIETRGNVVYWPLKGENK